MPILFECETCKFLTDQLDVALRLRMDDLTRYQSVTRAGRALLDHKLEHDRIYSDAAKDREGARP